jgi:hypothetical protein
MPFFEYLAVKGIDDLQGLWVLLSCVTNVSHNTKDQLHLLVASGSDDTSQMNREKCWLRHNWPRC